ncbi:MAG: DNA repair protein RecN, partial [Chloroflexota bacterium]|nr:DNA repair protein RecN [Chloroflexota bacterium]
MGLIELSVENLAVIESVRLPLAPGFNVVTGETGAGKSLVVDALGLALGGRAAADQVRSGAAGARVEAVFDAPDLAADDPLHELLDGGDGVVIVRREIAAEGRSMIRLNDRAVTVGTLAALGARLGEIHGQHEQQRLLHPEHQLTLIDRFGALEDVVDETARAHHAWRSVIARMEELITDAHELARRVELLEHQVSEIDAAGLRPGEDEELDAAVRTAQHAASIVRSASDAVTALRDDDDRPAAQGRVRSAVTSLRVAGSHDARFAALAERADGLAAEVQELALDIAAAADAVDLDPAAQAAAEERLTLIYDLKRKYGERIEDVIAFGRNAADQLAVLADQEALRARAREDEARTRGELETVADRLSAGRAKAATRLAALVNADLPPLGLREGSFGVRLSALAEIGPRGRDRVEFTFEPNPGEPARPLGRIASGGEASRLSLALKVVLAQADEAPMLIFDEIDAGVGGRNAGALGERLRQVSRFHQVLCVTHLPQIAAHADAHFIVRK